MVDSKYISPIGLTEYIIDSLFNNKNKDKDNEYYYRQTKIIQDTDITKIIGSWILFGLAFFLSWDKNRNLPNAERCLYAFFAGCFSIFYIIYYLITKK